MSALLGLSLDVGQGYARVRQQFARMPAASQRAMARALRKLSVWLNRQVLRAGSQASGIPQAWFKRALRYHTTITKEGGRPVGVSVWIGTNPIKVHRLGNVRWSRRMQGARVGRRSYPGSWSWGYGATGKAVMQRTGAGRLPIEVVREHIHEPVLARLRDIEREAAERFERLLVQELNYALNVEAQQ